MKTGSADLPLHYGYAPRWLFEMMVRLSREFVYYSVLEFGTERFIESVSDPFWFQSFGCLLGFDWHSSGLTTTVMGALKVATEEIGSEVGLFVAGGKGKNALKTPQEIEALSMKEGIDSSSVIYASRMAAKVDSTCVQDGFTLYHHTIVFDRKGNWAVVQQGMNDKIGYARRYHWLSKGLKSFVLEPHTAVCSDWKGRVLNMVAFESKPSQEAISAIVKEKPEKVLKEWHKIVELKMPQRHSLKESDLKPESLKKVLLTTYEMQPQDFESLIGVKGLGPKTLRALSLLAELLYGAKPSYRDPAQFSFAHGGKDGYPYPVDAETYAQTIYVMKKAVQEAKIGKSQEQKILRKIYALTLNS